MNDRDEKSPTWLHPSFDEAAARQLVCQLQSGLRVQAITPIGFPYALFQFAWMHRRWGLSRRESLLCVVDRCQGISASLEAAPLAVAPEGIECPIPRFTVEALEKTARRQAMQVQRGRLRRGGAITLINRQKVLKPLWRIEAHLPHHGSIRLLIDGLSGGYYLLEDTDRIA